MYSMPETVLPGLVKKTNLALTAMRFVNWSFL